MNARTREREGGKDHEKKGHASKEEQVLSSFATTETNEQTKVKIRVPAEVPLDTRICVEDVDESEIDIDQSKDNEKKGKQPGNGTQEPKKENSQGPGPGPRTREQTARDRDQEPVETKANLRNRRGKARFHARSSLSPQWWTRCTVSPTARFSTRSRMMKSVLSEAERTPSRDKELEHDVESDVAEETMSATVKLAKEIHEPYDTSQLTAECQLMTPSEKSLVTRCELRPVQGREDTKKRVMTSKARKRESEKEKRKKDGRKEGREKKE